MVLFKIVHILAMMVDKNTNNTTNNRQKTCGKRYIYIMSLNLSTVMQIFVREKCY